MSPIRLIFIFILLPVCGLAQTTVSYYLSGDNLFEARELKAVVSGKDFTLVSMSDSKCIQIEREADFNYDGYKDVLIEIVNGCGGNCCGDSYQIFCYDGQRFINTQIVGYDWDGIDIAESSYEYRFIVDTKHEGIDNTIICSDRTEIYSLKEFVLEIMSVIQDQKLNALVEIKAEDFHGRENEELFLSYDLDGDGRDDKNTCLYWSRWGRISEWKIMFGNGGLYKGSNSPKRIGIMKTKTNNVYDLVLECNEILKWNGRTYE
jgi:hypothetical protein